MAKPRHHRAAPGESGADRGAAVSLLRPARRPRAVNDNRLAWPQRLKRALPLLVVAALLALALGNGWLTPYARSISSIL